MSGKKDILRKAMNDSLYHVTAKQNVPGILVQGILANDKGLIYTVTDPRLAEQIALTQIFELDYAVIRILPEGITGRVRCDHVAESIARWHRVLKQPRIVPEFLELVGEYRTEVPMPTENTMRLWEFTGGSREECIENARRLFQVYRDARHISTKHKSFDVSRKR
jgi:hypothetical protein